MEAKAVVEGDDSSGEAAALMAVEKARSSSAMALDLSFQNLAKLPREISSLTCLQALDLRSNQLSVSSLLTATPAGLTVRRERNLISPARLSFSSNRGSCWE